MIRASFLLLISIVLVTSGYKCNDYFHVMYQPSEISKPSFYPPTWSGKTPIPDVDQNQFCSLEVKVNAGYYANVIFYKNYSSVAGVDVSDGTIFRAVNIGNNDNHPFFYVAKFMVEFKTDDYKAPDYAQFGFKIQWIKLPNVRNTSVQTAIGKPPIPFAPSDKLVTFQTSADSRMALIAFDMVDPSTRYLLRQSAVYEGSSFASRYIGNLWSVLGTERPLKSSTYMLSVYTFGLNNIVDYPLFMGQDYQDADQYNQYNTYSGANCPDTGDCQISFGSSGLTVTAYNGTETIKSFNYFTGTMNIYQDDVVWTAKIATLTSQNYKSKLPLQVKGYTKFYEVNQGRFTMTVSRG